MSRSRQAIHSFRRRLAAAALVSAVGALYLITAAPVAHAAPTVEREAQAHPQKAKTRDKDRDVVVEMLVSQEKGSSTSGMTVSYTDVEGPTPESPARTAGVRPAAVSLTEAASYFFSLIKGVKFGAGLSSFSVNTGAQMKSEGVVSMHAIHIGPKHTHHGGCSSTLTRSATLTGKFKLVSGKAFYGTTNEVSFPLTLTQVTSSCGLPCPPAYQLIGGNDAKHMSIFAAKSSSGKVSEVLSYNPPATASKPASRSFFVSMVNAPASDFTASFGTTSASAHVATAGGNTALTGSDKFSGGAPFTGSCGSKTQKTSSGPLKGNLTMHHDAVGNHPLGTASVLVQRTI